MSSGEEENAGSQGQPWINSRLAKLLVFAASFFLVMLIIAGLGTWPFSRHGDAAEDSAKSPAVILAMNDIYRINGIKRGTEGGLARIIRARKQLEQEGNDVLVLHAGDFLSPSLLGNSYYGAQMIDLMNLMDGGDGFDQRLIVTIGNHEFDYARCADPHNLVARAQGSDFLWLAGNLDFTKCDPALGPGFASMNARGNISAHRMVTLGDIRFGIFGVTLTEGRYAGLLTSDGNAEGYVAAAKAMTARLRSDGADYVIGLTHLNVEDDLKILDALGDDGPDLIIGGHDHEYMKERSSNGRYVYKQTADALDVGIHRFTRTEDEILHSYSKQDLKGDKDPAAQARVNWWLDMHEAAFCRGIDKPFGCLKDSMGTTQVDWQLEENRNRVQETSIGNWLADSMLAFERPTVGDCGADVPAASLLGSGSLRLNYNVPADFLLQRREVEELFPYNLTLFAICTDGATLHEALANGLSSPGAGKHPHIGGIRVVYTRPDSRDATASIISVATLDGTAIPNSDETKVMVVANDYTAGGGDGYSMWPKGPDGNWIDQAPIPADASDAGGAQADLKVWTLESFSASGENPVGPAATLEGQTCRLNNRAAPSDAGCTPLP